MPDVLGAVLVGGKSRRMGRDKALIEVDGIPFVERAARVLADAGCDRVVAIGPAELCGSVKAVADLHPGEGPLGGILTALATGAPVVVIACDLPWLDAGSVDLLLDTAGRRDCDVVMAMSDRLEPLCAVWNLSCAIALRRRFDAGERAVHRAIEALSVVTVDVPAEALRNVNRPDDLGIR